MLRPNWSVQNEIQRRADKESWVNFWENLPQPKLIELKKVKLTKDNVGWFNFVKTTLSALRP